MEKIKEENKSLIASRNNYFTAILLVNSGLVGLILSSIMSTKLIILILLGFYFNFIFINRYQNINQRIENNIKELN